MENTGKCPYCRKVLTCVNVEKVAAVASLTRSLKAHAFSCPSCHSILQVALEQPTGDRRPSGEPERRVSRG